MDDWTFPSYSNKTPNIEDNKINKSEYASDLNNSLSLDSVTFTGEILNEKLQFLCSV